CARTNPYYYGSSYGAYW
nr:immunoglobulin heavy chain junction region [Mus musculus]NSM07288.1 immunoglobulin heavy chain junction region [Mus musculus]